MSDAPEPPLLSKPLLIFDGDCGFCRRWVERGKSLTGDRVDYAPSQEVGSRFPDITPEQFQNAAWLILPDGTKLSGAAAILRALKEARGRGWMYYTYQHVPGFSSASEMVYRWVARHRPLMSRVTTALYGSQTAKPTYRNATRIFLRLVGLIYLIAFWSAWSQVPGLLGHFGILPADEFLHAVEQNIGPERFWRLPTLCWWIGSSDSVLTGMCGIGAIVSLFVIFGIAQGPCLLLLWTLYLSFTGVGQDFFSFQWDTLLLETGLLAVFVAPWRIRSWKGSEHDLSPALVWLLRFLLFKLMILSGATKLSYGDATWHDLTALTYHYETQPLPTWIGWYAHQLPRWFQQISCAVMYFVELFLPFFIFGTRRLKQIAFVGIVFLQVIIGLTGNYNFFNILTISLCVLLLDDGVFRKRKTEPVIKQETGARDSTGAQPILPRIIDRPAWRRALIAVTALFYVTVSTIDGYEEVAGRSSRSAPISKGLSYLRPFRSINGYGLFRVMTTTRPEIVLEGSDDAKTWIEYEFNFKPGNPKVPPSFIEPHQPRLDWQMWFAALSAPRYPLWFLRFSQRLLEGSPPVTGLLARPPFHDHPPKYLRAILYQYHFTTREERAATGEYWRRERQGIYLPQVSLKPKQ